MSEYSLDSLDSGLGDSSPLALDYPSSDSLYTEIDEISLNHKYSHKIKYISRSYIEMPQTGEVNYISTIIGVCGNPVYNSQGIWVQKSDKNISTTVKVDKDDIRAKRHYVKTLNKDGREIKIWECGLCGKEFRFQYTLVRHIPTHTDVRNYQCDICPKAFRQLSTLAQHKATHWNMRPFSCDFCSKSFNRISTLISHKKIHYDEKKHVCDFCGKGFHQKGNLRNHMYTHTNERPYKCDICGKGFNQKSNLVCHKISTHSRKDIYSCEICDITFGKQNLYSCHMESIHGGIMNSVNASKNHHFSSSIWGERGASEPQCTIIDEANNIIYSLPISVDKKENNSIVNICSADPLKGTKDQSTFEENEVLAIVDQEPTCAMLNSCRNKDIPFVLYYANGEIQPKICKVQLLSNGYLLKNPSNVDIAEYFASNKMISKSTKFPIVATIFQKKDSFGCLQYLVIPAGIQSQVIGNAKEETSEDDKNNLRITLHSENNDQVVILPESSLSISCHPLSGVDCGKSAIIYTKTQPNIRQIKSKTSLDIISSSKVNRAGQELNLPNGLLITPEIEPSDECEKNEESTNVFICETDYKEENTVECAYGSDDLISEDDNSFDINLVKDRNQVLFFRNKNLINRKPIDPIMVDKQESPISLKKEITSETLGGPSVPYSDIEPTLFMNSDNLKEPLSKYNLDFEEDNLDLLDAYTFSETFLENESNSMPEAPLCEYLTLPHPTIANPASPAYSLHPLL